MMQSVFLRYRRALPPGTRIATLLFVAAQALACSSLKEQKDVFIRINSDVPLELGNENSTVGTTNEWVPVFQLGESDLKVIIKADNIALDTLTVTRTRHPYNRVSQVVGMGAIAGISLGWYLNQDNIRVQSTFQTLGAVTLAAYGADVYTDPYRRWLKPNTVVNYTLPHEKKARYEQIMRQAAENALADAVRKPTPPLTTVDYLPSSMRAQFGLSSVPLSAPGPSETPTSSAAIAAGTAAPSASKPSASAPRPAPSSPSSSSTPSTLSTPAGTSGTAVAARAADPGHVWVDLKNTGNLPVRVYLSIEKSYVVRAQSTLPVQVPAGSALFMAKKTRPLELETIGSAPSNNHQTLLLDLQQIITPWK